VTTVDVLLKRGADVERADAEGRTALRAAAWGNFSLNLLFTLNYTKYNYYTHGQCQNI
jgi:hypothetical protein